MYLDEQGLHLEDSDNTVAQMLGNNPGEEGSKVLAMAISTNSPRVELRHWLYAFAKVHGSHVYTNLIEPSKKSPEDFINAIETSFESEAGGRGPLLTRLTSEVVSEEVTAMLEKANDLTKQHEKEAVTESILTLAIMQSADEELRRLVGHWCENGDPGTFIEILEDALKPPPPVIKIEDLFQESAEGAYGAAEKKRVQRLKLAMFDRGGRKLCLRLKEEVASFGGKKVTTLHLLYTLLGIETGLLYRGLSFRSIDIKKMLLASLTRQLAKPGARRNLDFELTEETLLQSVKLVLVEAAKMARKRRSETIAEADVSRAFVRIYPNVLVELFPKEEPLDLTSLMRYMDSIDPEELKEEEPVITISSIKEIEEGINKRIRGQEQAVARILPWIKRLRFGLPREGRPVCVFLFQGPTGTGKTQLAKELARYVFGNEEMLLFMEMGQFQTKESMSTFVGAPPGYVGYGEGKLTNGLREMPECVVLFDEIEKADVQVFDALLRFADEGLISDPAGPVRDGRRCIIVMTTNAGLRWLQDEYLKINILLKDPVRLEKALAEARKDNELPKALLEKAKVELEAKRFRPEFMGRIDELVTFLPFDLDTCRHILNDVLDHECSRIRDFRGIEINVNEEARQRLAEKTLVRSLTEGARGVPRTLNEFVISKVIDIVTEAEENSQIVTRLNVFTKGPEDIAVERA